MKSAIQFDQNDVYVNVDGEQKLIGQIFFETFVVKRDPQKHLMKKWNAYGFNAELVDSGKVKVIIVHLPDEEQLLISVDNVKTFGRLHQEEGWDKQYFVGVEHFSQV